MMFFVDLFYVQNLAIAFFWKLFGGIACCLWAQKFGCFCFVIQPGKEFFFGVFNSLNQHFPHVFSKTTGR